MHNEAVAVFVLMNLVTAIIAPGQRRKKQSCHEEETELFWTTGTDTSPVQLTTRRERERESFIAPNHFVYSAYQVSNRRLKRRDSQPMPMMTFMRWISFPQA